MLDTQRQVAEELKTFASTFNDVSSEISGRDTALRTILDSGSAASEQLKLLLKDNESAIPELLTNLGTFSEIQSVRLPNVRAVLELYPAIVADSFYALPPPGKDGISTARFGNILNATSFCSSGFSSTKTRSNKPKDWGGAANLDGYCHGKNVSLDTQQIDIRGSRNVPKPRGDNANVTNSDPYNGPHYGQPFPGAGKVGDCGTPTCPKGKNAKAKANAAAKAGQAAYVATSNAAFRATPVFYQPYNL